MKDFSYLFDFFVCVTFFVLLTYVKNSKDYEDIGRFLNEAF